MTATVYQLEILTPRGKVFSDQVIHVLIPAEDGFVGVLAHHTDYVTSSPGGHLELRLASGQTQKFRTGPGFFQVRQNEAFLLAQSVEDSASSSPPHLSPSPPQGGRGVG